ncbi:hypothetical protein NOVO_07985 [Rickettsiales bacterium Ac37b]|nr:hypothetical protein NOVO_07985 [Rickettsiales bacterium Ac37b]
MILVFFIAIFLYILINNFYNQKVLLFKYSTTIIVMLYTVYEIEFLTTNLDLSKSENINCLRYKHKTLYKLLSQLKNINFTHTKKLDEIINLLKNTIDIYFVNSQSLQFKFKYKGYFRNYINKLNKLKNILKFYNNLYLD